MKNPQTLASFQFLNKYSEDIQMNSTKQPRFLERNIKNEIYKTSYLDFILGTVMEHAIP